MTVDFDLRAYMRMTHSSAIGSEELAREKLRLWGRLLAASINLPVFGSNEWRALLERY